jgi:DNA gyrase subunit A
MQVMLISDGGTVIRIPVEGIKRSGRATQGVIVMRLREAEQVSSLALVAAGEDESTGNGLPDAAEALESEPTESSLGEPFEDVSDESFDEL